MTLVEAVALLRPIPDRQANELAWDKKVGEVPESCEVAYLGFSSDQAEALRVVLAEVEAHMELDARRME